jgi:hypothetical protein
MKQRSVRDSARARKPAAPAIEPATPAIEPAAPPIEPVTGPVGAEPPTVEEDAASPIPGLPALGEAPLREIPRGEPAIPLKERLRRIPPGVAVLTLAAVLSLAFLLFEIASRTASVQILTSAGLVCGIVYVAVAIACSAATWRLGHEERLWTALLVAFIGGCAAFVAAGSFAGALVLFLALGF